MSEGDLVAREVASEFGKLKLICELCSISFGTRGNLYTHLRKFHEIKIMVEGNQICPICKENFRTIVLLHEHLQNQHSVPLIFVDETFYSEKDFLDWKNKIEKESLSSYRIRNSWGKNSDVSHTYYICHRSGRCKTKQNRIRQVKASGSIKTGSTCPAVMRVSTQTVDGISEIKVRYQSVHIGHDLETRTLRLSKKERENLAACLKLGIPFDKILEDAKQNLSPANRYKHLTRKHLHNICRDFGISKKAPPKSAAQSNNDHSINNLEISNSSSSVVYEDYLEFEVSSQAQVQDQKEVLHHEKKTAVSSLLQLHNPNYSDYNDKKIQIICQLKDLLERVEKWDPTYPLPDVEEHIKAINVRLDISDSVNEILHLQGTLPIQYQASPSKHTTKRRKLTKVKKDPKKNHQN